MQAISQQTIKYNNLKRVYDLISKHGAISRAGLAGITKLSKTTISALTDELIATGYILDVGADNDTALGRKPNLLEVNSAENFVAVVVWHRNELVAALVDTSGNIVCQYKADLPEQGDYVSLTAKALYNDLLPKVQTGRILGVCIVVPAMIDEKNSEIISTVLRIQNEKMILDDIRRAIPDYPLAILNDTACYAYAECVYSDIIKKEVVFINLSRGVGAVMISHGAMLRGANGMTTQFGHFSVDRNGPICPCGSKGCLECLIGEGVLTARVEEYSILNLFGMEDKIQFKDIGLLADSGNSHVMPLVDKLAEEMAYGLSNVISLFNPELIVIGGTGKNLGERYLMLVIQKLKTMGFPRFVENVHVRFACVDESAEIQGAARYFLSQHFSFDGNMKSKLFLS